VFCTSLGWRKALELGIISNSPDPTQVMAGVVEGVCARVGHGNDVLDAHSPTSVPVHPGLDTECHAFCDRRLISLDDEGGFVDVATDAVTKAMNEQVAQPVVG
jgi:hypothetical protein